MFSSQSLLAFNSFGVEAEAKYFAEVGSPAQLKQKISEIGNRPILVLGGGSNILFTSDPESVVLYNNIKSREVLSELENEVVLRVGGGENWHEFVLWCLENNWGGLENLSLIPGTVGASPIQNIGAYGVELKDTFHGLEAVDLNTGRNAFFDAHACKFGYRNSIFKSELKGRLFITRVYFRLTRKAHQIRTDYGAIRDTLASWEVDRPTIQDVSRAVIAIRQSKLPDPKELGNAGSFFKNPEIEKTDFESLRQKFPELIFYPLPEDRYKIPAGWLIDQCGWKGKRIGPVGCYEKQALVLVNYGGASGEQVLDLAQKISRSVDNAFGIELETEVNIV